MVVQRDGSLSTIDRDPSYVRSAKRLMTPTRSRNLRAFALAGVRVVVRTRIVSDG